jgi:hypothetical protein
MPNVERDNKNANQQKTRNTKKISKGCRVLRDFTVKKTKKQFAKIPETKMSARTKDGH